jgi:hypothetical protein
MAERLSSRDVVPGYWGFGKWLLCLGKTAALATKPWKWAPDAGHKPPIKELAVRTAQVGYNVTLLTTVSSWVSAGLSTFAGN